MDPELDDEEQQALADDKLNPAGSPISDEDISSRANFVKALRNRLGRTEANAAQSSRDNALASALQKSAAQVGSFEGHVADTSPLDQFKKDLDASNMARMKGDQTLYGTESKGLTKELDLKNKQSQFAQGLKQKHDDFLTAQENENNRAKASADARAEAHSDALAARGDAASAKASDKQDQAYSSFRKDMETFRGNKEASQAAMDTYSAKKALAIVANKDPDTLTKQDLALLNSEIAKIAHGGLPGEHGIQDLMPNNLQTKAAELQNFLTSDPTDADAGEYVKHNIAYLKDMVKESDATLKSYRGNIAKGYKNRVKKEDYTETMKDYGLDNGNPAPSTIAPVSPKGASGGWGEAQAAPAAASSMGKIPKAGDVEGGYKFKGGDPSDKNNWEMQ